MHAAVHLNGALPSSLFVGYQPSDSGAVDDSTVCAECSSVVRNAGNLVVHMRRHLDYRPFVCSKCAYSGLDEDHVLRHASRSHPAGTATVKFSPRAELETTVQEMIAKCKTIAPSNGNELQTPLEPKPPPPPPPTDISPIQSLLSPKGGNVACQPSSPSCALCGSSVWPDASSVVGHLKRHLSFGGFTCPLCECAAPSCAALRAHVEQKHAAEAAGVTRRARLLLARTMVSVAEVAFDCGSDAPVINCALCGLSLRWSWAAIRAHVWEHCANLPFDCSVCKLPFADVQSLKVHFTRTHTNSFLVCTYKPQLKTSQTGDVFVTNLLQLFPSLNADSMADAPTGAPPLPTPTTTTTRAGAVSCQLCSAQISRSTSSLIAHTKVHLAYKPLRCDRCSFRHFAMSRVRRHTNSAHPGKSVKVSYHPIADIGRQLREMRTRCFGSLQVADDWRDPTELSDDDDDDDAMEAPSSESPSPAPLPVDSPEAAQSSASRLLAKLVEDNQVSIPLSASIFGGQQRASGAASRASLGSPDSGIVSSHRSSFETYDLSGMGKQACALCNTYIANNPSSFENHACKHLDYKPYHCQYCSYQSYIRGKVTRHIQQVHSGLPIRIQHRPTPGAKEKINQIKLKCFPFMNSTAPNNLNESWSGADTSPRSPAADQATAAGNPTDINCFLCNSPVYSSESAMDEHLQIHIASKFYHCPVCTYQTTFLIRAKQHVHSAHPSSHETRILCCPPEGLRGLHELRVRCFGANASLKLADSAPSSQSSDAASPWKDEMGADADDSDNSDSEASGDDAALGAAVGGRVTCALCKALVSAQPATISSHVRNHMTDYRPYECAYCALKSASEVDVKQHILATHKGVPLKVVFSPERDELLSMQERCFPRLRQTLAQSTASLRPPIDAAFACASPGSTLLKKLTCQICKNAIADNPKSVGIHVKNHLNYKPYRCPFCKYMSCEQSKARRHVEHVHNVSGDTVEIHAEEGVKEKISEMKARCFPTLNGGDTDSVDEQPTMVSGSSASYAQCCLCAESVAANALNSHVRLHVGKPFKCCHCANRFWTEDQMTQHGRISHSELSPQFTHCTDDDEEFTALKGKCFPDGSPIDETRNDFDEDDEQESSALGGVMGRARPTTRGSAADGKLSCRVCESWVSVNPNSLEVHAKTHLNFKQHQCGYCNYRSCIAGKVKRHLDNVHRGQPVSMLSFTSLSVGLKATIADMRSLCFPEIEGDHLTRTRDQLTREVGKLKRRLVEEMDLVDTEELDERERAAAAATAAVIGAAGPPGGKVPLAGANHLALTPPPPPPPPADDSADRTDAQTPAERDEMDFCNGSESTVGKLQCHLCSTLVADNPSSLGLHVRNHLDYKPFSCNLCDYKSCIQAKVKRHLRNVHKCPTDQMTYSPEPDIRLKVMDMKMRCFPKMIEAAESAMGHGNTAAGDGTNGTAPFDAVPRAKTAKLDASSSCLVGTLESILGAKMVAGMLNSSGVATSEQADAPLMTGEKQCRVCQASVANDEQSSHAASHGASTLWSCSTCERQSDSQDEMNEHVVDEHAAGEASVVAGGESPARLVERCFGEAASSSDDDDDDEMDDEATDTVRRASNGVDGPRYICQLCGQAVSMYASSLYVHVKNHMNYKPYHCAFCDYRSPVKSKVRRHIQNAHRKKPLQIDYFPTAGIEHEVMRMKKECFPDVTSFATPTNDKVPCNLCKTDVADTLLSKSVHAKNHLDAKPYHCGYCSYRSCLKGETRRHVSRQHCGRSMRIVTRDDETARRADVDAMLARCFDAAPAMTRAVSAEQAEYAAPAAV